MASILGNFVKLQGNMFEEPFNEDFNDSEFTQLINRFEDFLNRKSQHYFDEDEFSQIISYYTENKSYPKALKAVQIALNQYPSSSLFLIRQAQLFGANNQVGRAFEILVEAESLDPGNAEIFFTRGSLYSHLNEHDKAIHAFRQAYRLAEEKEDIAFYLALEYAYKKDFDKAIGHLKKILMDNPEHELAIYEISWCYEESGRTDESVVFFNHLLDINSFSPALWYNLGMAYMKIETYAKAAQAFDYAILIDESFLPAYHNKAAALANLERYAEAIEVYKETLRIDDSDPFVFYNMGECFEKTENLHDAGLFYKKALNLDPEMALAHVGLGVVASLDFRYQEAVHHIRRGIDIEDKNPEFWYILADVQHKAGFFEEAEKAYQQVLTFEPENYEARLDFTVLLVNEGRNKEALEFLLEGTRLHPDLSIMWYRLAAVCFINGKRQEGFVGLAEGLTLNPAEVQQVFEFEPSLKLDADIQSFITHFNSL